MNNPYVTLSGFGLRVYRAERAIKKLAVDPWKDIYTRKFDNCFECGDGSAVVWALMHKAHNDLILKKGIQTMFSNHLQVTGAEWPEDWQEVYLAKHLPKTLELFP